MSGLKHQNEKVILLFDRDLLDPDSTFSYDIFHNGLKTMELSWEKPQEQKRLEPSKVKSLTKRVVQLMYFLIEADIQLENFKFCEWYDVFAFKKIIYHISRFLKTQMNLKTLIFQNIHLPKNECLRIIGACTASKLTVTCLKIRNQCYKFNKAFETFDFLIILQQFMHLCELRLDYHILSQTKVMDVITEIGKNNLKLLKIYFDEMEFYSIVIPRRKWRYFQKYCPNTKVSIAINDFKHYEHLEFVFLMSYIPLHGFYLTTNAKYTKILGRNYKNIILRLVRNYSSTLEKVYLQFRNNQENLNEALMALITKCPNIKVLTFDGLIDDSMSLFEAIRKFKKPLRGVHMAVKAGKETITNIVNIYC